MNTIPQPLPIYPLVIGQRDEIHIVQPEAYYKDGKPLPAWLNPPMLIVPLPEHIYRALPFPKSEHGEYKVNADGKMHVVFYPE